MDSTSHLGLSGLGALLAFQGLVIGVSCFAKWKYGSRYSLKSRGAIRAASLNKFGLPA